jgi:hypothetical protein
MEATVASRSASSSKNGESICITTCYMWGVRAIVGACRPFVPVGCCSGESWRKASVPRTIITHVDGMGCTGMHTLSRRCPAPSHHRDRKIKRQQMRWDSNTVQLSGHHSAVLTRLQASPLLRTTDVHVQHSGPTMDRSRPMDVLTPPTRRAVAYRSRGRAAGECRSAPDLRMNTDATRRSPFTSRAYVRSRMSVCLNAL